MPSELSRMAQLPCQLKRDVAMLLFRHGIDFRFEHPERADQAAPGFARLDHVVDEAVLGSDERAGETLVEFSDLLLPVVPLCAVELAAIHNVDGAFRAHDGDLG